MVAQFGGDFGHCDLKCRMHRLRRYLRERKHHEMHVHAFWDVGASVQVVSRTWSPIHEDVDVQSTRLVRVISSAPVSAFDVQKPRTVGPAALEFGSNRHHHVEIFRLVLVDTERLGFVNR